MSTQYLEDTIYEVEIMHKGSTRLAFAYYLGGLWYSQGDNVELEGKIKPHIEKPEDINTITITWSVADVLSRAKDTGVRCSRKRALEILHLVKEHHDANFGISWETFDSYLENN